MPVVHPGFKEFSHNFEIWRRHDQLAALCGSASSLQGITNVSDLDFAILLKPVLRMR